MNTNRFVEIVLIRKIKNMSKSLVYDTTLEINMSNLVSNLTYFRSLLSPKTKIMVMVKAFSYGLGTYEVAKLLEENKVDYLGVANIYEGIELRNAGIHLPIMVMKPEIDSFNLMVEFQLTPAIFSIHALNKLMVTLAAEKRYNSKNPYIISIKLDTGMHRLGFDEHEIEELIQDLKQHTNLKIESIFSHLVATDEEKHDEFTQQQIELFNKMADSISKEFNYHMDRHILNSNGIIRFNAAQMDMVRLGIGLYGVSSELASQRKLLSVSSLKSKIAQLKNIKKGETVGYNRNGLATKDLITATIPVGYADGLNRKLGNGNWQMIVNGKKVSTIGNVCMDMVMIDVTNVPCKEGDEVFVFSENNSIAEMAKCIHTIPYEILTAYSPRVKRIFVKK
ncbi:MAG: alanine racemase [Flavobacteriales bacterium CG_4_9_14_3_um_filter_32_8]|nr:MAG: alanine racemase [Flavobacteriales bacterium CG_4_9_14_3_um_filter_32_8]